jgi:AraC family transcriptional regulator of adaptative response/methylated-DNA-[protein]-cysteine methyltransferase
MSGVALAARVRSGQDDPVSDLYAVRTTGIVCRVGCASKAPRPENVAFFDDLRDALAAGYRPCKRCRPDAEHPQESFRAHLVHRAVGYLRLGLSVADTAARLHVSERHLRRLVQQQTGLSPRELATA